MCAQRVRERKPRRRGNVGKKKRKEEWFAAAPLHSLLHPSLNLPASGWMDGWTSGLGATKYTTKRLQTARQPARPASLCFPISRIQHKFFSVPLRALWNCQGRLRLLRQISQFLSSDCSHFSTCVLLTFRVQDKGSFLRRRLVTYSAGECAAETIKLLIYRD